MRKQGVDAGLVLRIIKQELGSVVLSRHGIVGLHGHRAIRVTVRRHSITKQQVIGNVNEGNAHNDSNEDSLEPPFGRFPTCARLNHSE